MIFYRLHPLDPKLIYTKKLSHYVCAALAVGAKFECSKRDYLDAIYAMNCPKVAKKDITDAENHILEVTFALFSSLNGRFPSTYLWSRS
jgi:hypothetical protein